MKRSSAPAPVPRKRIFDLDLIERSYKLTYNGNTYDMPVTLTAYGDVFMGATEVSMVSTGHKKKPAMEHYAHQVREEPSLVHHGKQLVKHIQVRD